MLDDIHSDGGLSRNGQKRPRQANDARPVSDREVPLLQPDERRLSAAVHAWLDGDLSEAAARKAEGGKDVDFWKRLEDESARRRHMRTPTTVQARIIASIPEGVPTIVRPWYRRELVLTPRVVIVTATALVVAASAITAAFVFLGR
jgi:hypothetical protein